MLAKLTAARGVLRGFLAARLDDAIDLLLPHRCPRCGAVADPVTWLCTACRAAIPRLSMALCVRCLAREREPVGCRAHAGFAVWPAWLYDDAAERLVHALKYGGCWRIATGVGDELARVIAHAGRFDAILPVPLHAARLRERGYNQAALLAGALAERIGAPCVPRAIARARPTLEQARLGGERRRSNVAGAFRVARPEWVAGRKVLVVDDVVTTGATLESCLDALRRAGAEAEGVALAWAQ